MEIIPLFPMEPEIAAPPPRRVRLPRATRALLAAAALLLGLIALGGVYALNEAARLAWLSAHGRTLTGHVTSLEMQPPMTGGQPARPQRLHFSLPDAPPGFATVGVLPLVSDDPTDRAHAPRLPDARTPHVGDPLPFRAGIWLGRPTLRAWGPDAHREIGFLTVSALGVLAVCAALAVSLVRWLRAQTRLLRDGIAVVGEVLGKKTLEGDTPQYLLCYGYTSSPDARAREREERVSPEQWKRFEVGDPVTVLYDAADPARSSLYALMR